MGRWTQYDEPEYRTGGLRRVGYDADSQRYYFQDGEDLYEGEPRVEMGGQMRYIGQVGRPSPPRAVHEDNDSLDPPTPPPQSPRAVHENDDHDLWHDPPPPPPPPSQSPQPPCPEFEYNCQSVSPTQTVSTSKSFGSAVRAGRSPEPASQPSVSRLRQIRRSIMTKCRAVGGFPARSVSKVVTEGEEGKGI